MSLKTSISYGPGWEVYEMAFQDDLVFIAIANPEEFTVEKTKKYSIITTSITREQAIDMGLISDSK